MVQLDDPYDVIKTVSKFYPFVSVVVRKTDYLDIYFHNSVIDPVSGRRYENSFLVDNRILLDSNLENLILERELQAIRELIFYLEEKEVVGRYPFARIYHDRLTTSGEILFEKSEAVPGWIFGRITRGESPYPKDRAAAEFNSTKAKTRLEEISHKESEFIKEIEMAKKRVVRTAPVKIDPEKVKKPNCAVHQIPMEYDIAESKWACTVENCNMVARPKRAADDRNVIMGKGGLSLRIMATDGQLKAVLMSDDNVALDVTDLLTIKNNLDISAMHDSEKNNVAVMDSRKFEFEMPYTVLNVKEVAELFVGAP